MNAFSLQKKKKYYRLMFPLITHLYPIFPAPLPKVTAATGQYGSFQILFQLFHGTCVQLHWRDWHSILGHGPCCLDDSVTHRGQLLALAKQLYLVTGWSANPSSYILQVYDAQVALSSAPDYAASTQYVLFGLCCHHSFPVLLPPLPPNTHMISPSRLVTRTFGSFPLS